MWVRLIVTLEGGAMEFGADAKAAKSSLAAYLRSLAVRVENLNEDNAMCSIADDISGDTVGSVNLAIIGGGA